MSKTVEIKKIFFIKKAAKLGGFSQTTGGQSSPWPYLPLRAFKQLVQMFFPLNAVMSLESPQKMQAG